MKRMRFLIVLSLLLVILIGGQSHKTTRPAQGRFEHLTRVSVSKTGRNRGMNNDFFVSYNDPDTLKIFKEALQNSKKESVLNILVASDYNLLFTYNNDEDGAQWLHLYLGQSGERSAFVYHGYEDMAYFTSKESTEKLRELLQPDDAFNAPQQIKKASSY